MARQITQETFDAVVLENIEEFEMSPEEAVVEAVTQFEAQGVNLDLIVKVFQPKNDTGEVIHAVVSAVNNLKDALTQSTFDIPQLSAKCDALRAACSVSLADRCLAVKHGAYDVLMSAIDTDPVGSLCLPPLLMALRSLVDGQPDILDDRGSQRLVALIREFSAKDPELLAILLVIVRRCCLLHEGNRQRFVGLGIIAAITDVLSGNRSNRDVVRAACNVFSALTLDDDIRVPFGKGFEHAKAIVVEGDAFSLLLNLASVYLDETEVLADLFGLVGRLSVRDEFCQKVLELGGVTNIMSVLQTNVQNQSLVRSLLLVIKSLAGSDPVKKDVVRSGGIALVVDAIRTHPYNASISEAGCAAIAALVLRFPDHSNAVVDANGPEVICTAMELHRSLASVQKQACMAVRNVVSRRTDIADPFLRLEAERLLRQTLATHATCYDEARAALRDLGCAIELKERWTGTGKQLQQ